MAFGNKQNNSSDLNVNTNGIQFYNMEGIEPSTLQLNFWNGLLALKICPALPENKREESKKYDYETFITCLMTPQRICDLLRILEREFYPAYLNNPSNVRSDSVASGEGFIQLSAVQSKDKEQFSIALTIFKDVDTNAKTDSYLCYEFRKGPWERNPR
jgi:hypothetical protein